MIQIYNTLEKADWEQLQSIYQRVGWTKHTPAIIQQIFEASHIIAIAMSGDRIVGFGRALSDGIFNGAIYDVVVDPDFQGNGIGKQIIDNLLWHLREVSCVHLIATTGNEAFYHKSGFRPMKTAMGRYRNPALSEEYLI
ncbi:GNAT family N-acetyltransferase [Ectobacillus sp. JY-23]|uniref:GNAT family N-acetyltransferase n=1 Tax=Ectobacillus sp. JY-23 TaxID=2933872 RepID=UPI001FF5E600|nr:GNAT family N-acetyltransferase [Ectobacillus sp. JY-23]UOY92210.1 GNAT family N-acetyltransferase [Ectobacillus sp. JY-23]